jgi:hypothetical protein
MSLFRTYDSSSNPLIGLYTGVFTSGKPILYVRSSLGESATYVEGTTNVLDGAWHNIVAVRNTAIDKLQIFVDGRKNATDATDGMTGTCNSNDEYYIGRSHTAGEAFYGNLDELKVFNKALSVDEIIAYYKSELGTFITAGDEELQSTPCSCPTSGNWEITAGNYCLLTDTCNSTGTLHIANGAGLHIALGGILNIPATFKAIIEFGGRLSINSGASFRINK